MSQQNDDARAALSPAEVLRIEAEAEARTAALVAEARANLGERCPECGNLGSLEVIEGKLTCIDCDFDVMSRSQLGGLGKK